MLSEQIEPLGGTCKGTYPPSIRISMFSRSSAVRWANSGGRRTQVLPAVTESSRRCFSAKMLGSQCLYLHNAVPVCA